MNKNKISQQNEVCFKENLTKKPIPEKTARGKKNLSKIFIDERFFRQINKRY